MENPLNQVWDTFAFRGAWQNLNRSIGEHTPKHTPAQRNQIARRRARNKMARRSRRINRIRAAA